MNYFWILVLRLTDFLRELCHSKSSAAIHYLWSIINTLFDLRSLWFVLGLPMKESSKQSSVQCWPLSGASSCLLHTARYLLTYLDCCLYLFILIILFLSIYILLHIFNAFSAPRCNAFILFKALWIVLYMKCAIQINLTLTFDFQYS